MLGRNRITKVNKMKCNNPTGAVVAAHARARLTKPKCMSPQTNLM